MLCQGLGSASPSNGRVQLRGGTQLCQRPSCKGPGDPTLLRSRLPALLTLQHPSIHSLVFANSLQIAHAITASYADGGVQLSRSRGERHSKTIFASARAMLRLLLQNAHSLSQTPSLPHSAHEIQDITRPYCWLMLQIKSSFHLLDCTPTEI